MAKTIEEVEADAKARLAAETDPERKAIWQAHLDRAALVRRMKARKSASATKG